MIFPKETVVLQKIFGVPDQKGTGEHTLAHKECLDEEEGALKHRRLMLLHLGMSSGRRTNAQETGIICSEFVRWKRNLQISEASKI